MTFFYDLNKRLANLDQKQTLAESAVAEAGYSAKAARAGKDIGQPGKNFEKIAKGAAERYGSKAAGERVAGAVLNKLRHPKEGVEEAVDKVAFAALAEPKDKITFADKIAGAKQEVEEMLGDVAAEAIKSALSPKQKKLDRNNNGKLDAQDFEMLRKGGKQETDEGFPTVAGARAELNKRKVGDVTHGAKHDVEEIPGGRRVTRRTDDKGYSVGSETDDEGNKKEKQTRRGAPEKKNKKPERVTAKATKHKGGRKEKVEEGPDEGVDMVKLAKVIQSCKTMDQLEAARKMAQNFLRKHSSGNDGVGFAGIGKDFRRRDAAVSDIERKKAELQGNVEEEKTTTRDNRAEKAGKKVTKDLEYDMKHKGKDDAKAEKAGKKVTKDIEYDEKKKKVKETTSSGSVATGGAAPKAGKGGIQIGKGIYDSLNREIESMIAESMSINVSMTDDDNGAHKNITVTASDEDAEILAQLLQRAGLAGGATEQGQEEPCPTCGSTDCGCDEVVDEAYGDTDATQNQPDWPTDTEYSDDAFQYSGGLNKPKTDVAGDGQTTVPTTAVHTQDEEALRRMMEMAGIKNEGIVDKAKEVGKKVAGAVNKAIGHGSDEELLKKLQKDTGVEQTGKKPEPKAPVKMEESLMQEFSNFKI